MIKKPYGFDTQQTIYFFWFLFMYASFYGAMWFFFHAPEYHTFLGRQ
jgi:hypothetical protein